MCTIHLSENHAYFTFVFLCYLLISFANTLDPDQARQNVGPDLDPNCLTLMAVLKFFSKKLKSMQNYPAKSRANFVILPQWPSRSKKQCSISGTCAQIQLSYQSDWFWHSVPTTEMYQSNCCIKRYLVAL